MTSYVIVYEQTGSADAAGKIHEAVKQYARWGRVTGSCWVVSTENKTAVDIRDEIGKVIQTGDRLFVVRSGTEGAWRNTRASNEWLKQNL